MNLCSTPAVCHSRCKHSLHAGLITRPPHEVRSREETERDVWRKTPEGLGKVSQEIRTNIK